MHARLYFENHEIYKINSGTLKLNVSFYTDYNNQQSIKTHLMKINCSCSVIPLLKYFSHMFVKRPLSSKWTPSNHRKEALISSSGLQSSAGVNLLKSQQLMMLLDSLNSFPPNKKAYYYIRQTKYQPSIVTKASDLLSSLFNTSIKLN
jgi:hypothetical protein